MYGQGHARQLGTTKDASTKTGVRDLKPILGRSGSILAFGNDANHETIIVGEIT